MKKPRPGGQDRDRGGSELFSGLYQNIATAAFDQAHTHLSRGYSSLSFLHSAAKTIIRYSRPSYIYQFGDLDPSGVDIARDIETKLRRYALEADIHFERVAVTREQADKWELPTRPTKTSDTRAKKFKGKSVELDAIPPDRLRGLVHEVISRHVDQDQLKVLKVAEKSERAALEKWANLIGGIRA